MMIAFRCDAGPKIGFGHLMRCRALAEALVEQGAQCMMIGPLETYKTAQDDRLFTHWHELREWKSAEEDARVYVALAGRYGARVGVLDDYRVDEAYQLVVRDAGIRWLQFESTMAMPIWADIVLNANPAAKESDYSAMRKNPDTRFLLGPRHAVLRPEFRNLPDRTAHEGVRTVLLTFGAGDDRGMICRTLKILTPSLPKHITYVVMTGRHNPNLPTIETLISTLQDSSIRLLVNPPDVAGIMMRSDLSIMAGGTTTFEAAACGLPMMLIAIAENQVKQSTAWSALGAAVFLGRHHELNDETMMDAIQGLASNPDRLQAMSASGRLSINGIGARETATFVRDLSNRHATEAR